MSQEVQVIFVSASVGAGHNQAAAAVMAVLQQRYPYVQTEFIDVLQFVPWWFRTSYAGLYTLGVTRFPGIYGWTYRAFDRAGPKRSLNERARLLIERVAVRPLRRRIMDRRPSLVVATHYLGTPMLGRLIGRGLADMRLWTVMTDYEAHRFWYAENVDRFFVASDRVRQGVQSWGYDAGQIEVCGIPVHPKWTAPLQRQAVRRRWDLPAEGPIIVLSPGAYFTVGPVGRIARGILDSTDAHVVVLAGSNKKLLAALAGFPEAGRRLTSVPFTDRAHELLEVASLMVSKSGGLTTSECIAKGVPMVLTKPVPGQESANAEMLVAEGAAVIAPTVPEVIDTVTSLISAPEALEAFRSNAHRLYRPAAETIAEEIVRGLDE